MKNYLFILILLMVSVSCGPNQNGGEVKFASSTRVVSKQAIETNYQIAVIDGCEYIYYSESHGYSGYGFMAHKGNCKNPIHEHNFKKLVQINIDSIKAAAWQEYRAKLSPEYQKMEQAKRNAEVEMIRAQVQLEKAKQRLDSIKYYNR